MAPSVRFYETPSAPPYQWYPNSERVSSGAVANDDFSMPRQRIPIVDQPSVGPRYFVNLDPEFRQRTKQKPEKFDGSSDWADYIKHFEMVSLWNGWWEDEKAVQLSMSLTGTARQAWADSFTDPQASLSPCHGENVQKSSKLLNMNDVPEHTRDVLDVQGNAPSKQRYKP